MTCLVVVNAESLRTAGCSPDQILLTAIAQDVTDVIVDGRTVVMVLDLRRRRDEYGPEPEPHVRIGRYLRGVVDCQ